jgi:hypothetical protein
MWKTFLFLFLLLCAVLAGAIGYASAAELSDTEARWLKGVWPVVAFAHSQGLPLDVVVQPQDSSGAVPLALGFVDGRCKLVLSMRGNAEAQATLDRIEPELLNSTLELMAAHELGHCRRYLDGAWYDAPAGFRPPVPAGLSDSLRAAWIDRAAARREEAYGDLVGLMWTRREHPEQYARLHDWLAAERAGDVVPGNPHDTLAWIELAGDGSLLGQQPIFAAAAALWRAGLASGE